MNLILEIGNSKWPIASSYFTSSRAADGACRADASKSQAMYFVLGYD
jgi:hypothetical protein